jgi:hypothetical protein
VIGGNTLLTGYLTFGILFEIVSLWMPPAGIVVAPGRLARHRGGWLSRLSVLAIARLATIRPVVVCVSAGDLHLFSAASCGVVR